MADKTAQKTAPTVIKKYANRRLYHTGTSSYVTLEDLSGMVRAGEDFVVTDAKTGEDITRPVLTQIIFEEETKTEQNLLPIAFLRQLIRFYGDSLQGIVPRFLEFSLDSLSKEQQTFRAQLQKTLQQGPFGQTPFGQAAMTAVEEQARLNMAMFQEAFRLFNPFTALAEKNGTDAGALSRPAASKTANGAAAHAAGAAPADDPAGDIEALKRQFAEMQQRLDKLAR